MNPSDFTRQVYKARDELGAGATPQRIYARLLPPAQDAWDANDLPDIWLTDASLYTLRQRLAAMAREGRAK